MNRILQKLVGDTSSSSSSSSQQRQTSASNSRTPASTGNMSSSEASWASASYHGQGQTTSYSYANQSQQQQQYYGQQQPVSDGGGYEYRSQQQYNQQQGYVATNSQGQYLDEIPLSSPQANAKPDAATLFSDTAHYAQQQSYYGYDGYAAQHQQQQYPVVAADSFFQSAHSVTSSGSAPPRSASGSPDPFAQPPRSSSSSRSGSGFGHFQDAADPFAASSSLSFTTSATSTSLNAFEHQQQQSPFHAQQQEPASLSRSTSGTASDLFANPSPSNTPSYDGFDHQQQRNAFGGENHSPTTLTTTGSAADLFATSAPATQSFYDGFVQQSDNGGWDLAAPTTAASAELFESATPAAASPPSPFDSFSPQQQHAHEHYAPSSESASLFGESTTVDPFANPPQSTASSSHSNGFSQQNDSVVDNVNPFASSSQSFSNSNNSFEQHFEQPQQQHQYYASNQELGPFGNSTGASSSAYSQADPFASSEFQHQADPFATTQPESEYENHIQRYEQVDPFVQQPVASSDFGYHIQEYAVTAAAPPVSLSPTQVNDFFSDAPPSVNSLFSTHSTSSVAKSPRPPLSPKKPATPAQEQNGLGFSPRKPVSSSNGEPSFASPAIPPTPTTTTTIKKEQESNPVTANEDEDDEAEAISLQLTKTTLDDSHTLVEMYKHMAERLEGEKNELLKVLADQADQFYQMQEYIASLEQELAAHRSNNSK